MLRRVSALVLIVASSALAVEPPIPAGERAKMLAEFAAEVTALSQTIAKAPPEVALYSRRGDCHLFLGRFADAVADFEKMIALDPAQDAPHWRLGIAYYFAGLFAKSARQFEKYHLFDGGDRENGIWKFLGDVKVLGLKPAQRAMLVYPRFDREPFPALYEMFAGRKSTGEFFTEIKERQLADDPRVMFFANYYAGLNEEILGHHEPALALLRAAVASPWGRSAEGGPAYMWQVARLHFEALSASSR
ncbi:MAG: tetratricopeptide repeat protein [Opitutus sp.]|nr:tetratricopeptide repeat protein [Opitutus sp.]